MERNKANSKDGRREPYNQPIKVYGAANPEVSSRSRRVVDKTRRERLTARRGCTIDESVGKEIAYHRTRDGLSVEQLAERMEMSPERLKKIEAGKGNLTVILLGRIARALNRSLEIRIVGI